MTEKRKRSSEITLRPSAHTEFIIALIPFLLAVFSITDYYNHFVGTHEWLSPPSGYIVIMIGVLIPILQIRTRPADFFRPASDRRFGLVFMLTLLLLFLIVHPTAFATFLVVIENSANGLVLGIIDLALFLGFFVLTCESGRLAVTWRRTSLNSKPLVGGSNDESDDKLFEGIPSADDLRGKLARLSGTKTGD